MKELVEIAIWAVIGVFTYVLIVSLNHTIWELLK
jgi:hypothetical protein